MSLTCIVAAVTLVSAAADPPSPSIFAKNNLAAWCIVPFDASRRGPVERAAMLKKLGITKLAYDWRDEHVPTFEEEILALQKQGIEFFAYWCPLGDSPANRAMMGLIEKYHLHPQIWTIAPPAEAESQEKRVEVNAQAMVPLVKEAQRLGCQLALYNHGGWSGEPENMIAMVQWLRQHTGTDSVGIVYNFHHGHEHLAQFPAAFKKMLPYLTCVNLNGMTIGGEKILPVGQGQEDQRVLEMIRDSGYRGPIGILGHREQVDAEKALQENLAGLKKLLPAVGEVEAAKTYGP
jgi:sugar phosphate isomerase/epimerase